MITDHRYDAGWPRDDSEGCIASVPCPLGTLPGDADCGQPEAAHTHSEYPSQRPERNHGAMHEPKPYTGELEWSDLAHPFID